MAKAKADSWDSEENEVQSNWVKFNVPLEDKIFGTLVAKRQIKSTMAGKEGELQWVYDLKADTGSYHVLDESKEVVPEAVVVEAGGYYTVAGKPQIDRQMQNIRRGQKVGFKFIDETPSKSKGFNPSKNVKVYAPKNDDGTVRMDEDFLNAENVANFDKENG